MNYADIINQVVAEAIDREVKNQLAAKDGEIASLKALLGDRDREVAKLIDDISELKRKGCQNAPLDGAIARTYGTVPTSPVHVQQDEIADLRGQVEKKDKELVALRRDVLDRGNRIESLQAELNGVRGALKNHVDSENKLRKELDDANTRIEELEADLDTRIDKLEDNVREKDNLIEKYRDMADAISDWTTNDMPSLDPNDY